MVRLSDIEYPSDNTHSSRKSPWILLGAYSLRRSRWAGRQAAWRGEINSPPPPVLTMSISRALAEAAAMVDQKAKIERYKALQIESLSAGRVDDLKQFIEHIVGEDVPLVASRQVLTDMAAGLSSLGPEALKEVGLFAVESIHPRVTSFEEQVSVIREALATLYEAEEDWTNAAKMLSGIPLDSGIRVLEDNYKVEKYIKISMLYLQVRRRSWHYRPGREARGG